jgi:RNA polymerase sigma-70 factor, ECF subfamily
MPIAQRIEKLLHQLERPLVAYGFSLSSDLEASRDAVQNAFIKYIEFTSDDSTRVENPKAWLYRVVYNQIMDLKRKEKLHNKYKDEIRSTQEVHDAQTPSRELEMKTMKENLKEEIKKLNELEQRVFQLRVYREYSYQLIAEEMDIKTTHVGVILHRALRKLSGQLKSDMAEVLS